MARLVIHATNVHQGGGAVLLADLLRSIPPDLAATVAVDARMRVPDDVSAHVRIERVQPSLLDRLWAEIRLSCRARADDQVLCFGNLPPLFRVHADVSVFLQNRYLVDRHAPLGALPVKLRLRLLVERAWLACCRGRARRYFVQTPSMKRLAEECLGVPVVCAPFVPEAIRRQGEQSAGHQTLRFDFVYVASGEAHKNHAALISAWGVLAEEGIFPSLALTLAPAMAPELVARLAAETSSRGVRIYNLGSLSHDKLVAVYRESGALIYPSGFESFGLPLIEARLAGLPVLAPELDYVRDIIDPEETFDPSSPVSIARAVLRHLKGRRKTVESIGVGAFLERLMQGAGQ